MSSSSSSHGPGSLPVPRSARPRWSVLAVFVAVASLAYAIFLQVRVHQLTQQLVQEASSASSPLGLCQTAREHADADLARVRTDLTSARDARVASEQKESECLIHIGLLQKGQSVPLEGPSTTSVQP